MKKIKVPTDDVLDADHDDAPLRLLSINEVVEDVTALGLTCRALDGELNFTSAEEPTSFREAEQLALWRALMAEEMKAIHDNDTWELASLPVGHGVIGLKWVYKVKRNEVEEVILHKARLVVKGYVQRLGVDFEEVFMWVAHLEFACMMVALAAHGRWSVHHMDVKSVFLNGTLREEVYV
jgi:hypothetical protein